VNGENKISMLQTLLVAYLGANVEVKDRIEIGTVLLVFAAPALPPVQINEFEMSNENNLLQRELVVSGYGHHMFKCSFKYRDRFEDADASV